MKREKWAGRRKKEMELVRARSQSVPASPAKVKDSTPKSKSLTSSPVNSSSPLNSTSLPIIHTSSTSRFYPTIKFYRTPPVQKKRRKRNIFPTWRTSIDSTEGKQRGTFQHENGPSCVQYSISPLSTANLCSTPETSLKLSE